MTGNPIYRFYFVRFPLCPVNIQKDEFEKQYQLINKEQTNIIQELAQRKGEEHEINEKLMQFWHLDEMLEWNMSILKNLELWNQDKVNLPLPNNLVSRTTGYLCLNETDAPITITPDRKRCQKRVLKNGRMNIEYLQQVHEEHLFVRKPTGITSCDTQELNNMIESMVQRIHHGNQKRGDEMKMYEEIRNFLKTKEIFIAQEPDPQRHQWYNYTREIRSKHDVEWKRSLQHDINIRLDNIENIKRKQVGRTTRVRRLKAELEHAKRDNSFLNKKLENVNLKRLKAYNRVRELREKTKMNSSYKEYQSLKRHVKKLARNGDVVELEHVCNTQVEEFMGQWNDSKAFREEYEKRSRCSQSSYLKLHSDI